MTQKSTIDPNVTPENIGTLTSITSPLWWVIVAVLMTIGTAVVVWSIVGEVFVTVSGLGILVPTAGSFTTVSSIAGGRVVKIPVKVNEHLQVGDMIAEIDQPVLKDELNATKLMVVRLKDQREHQTRQYEAFLADRERVAQENIANLQAKIKSLRDASAFSAKMLADTEDELKQGFATRTQVEQARIDKSTNDFNQRDTYSQIQTIRNQLADDRSTVQRQLFSLDQDILKTQQQAENYEKSLSLAQNITAPIDGIVASLTTAEGKMVTANAPVAVMEPVSPGLTVAAYFLVADGKQIHPQAKAQIKIGSVDSNIYGTAVGTVEFVADLPSTSGSLRNVFENDAMVNQFEQFGSPIKVIIKLEEVPGKPGFVMMSSGRPSPFAVSTGTTVTAQVVVHKSAPISYIFQLFK